MAKAIGKFKSNPISQLFVLATLVLMVIGTYESTTGKYILQLGPTQLFIVAAVLGILALYLKDER